MDHGLGPARRALAAVFLVNGAVLASWVPHIPAARDRHALGDGALGLVLLAMAAGAVLALPAAGWLVERLGSRAVTRAAALTLCLALPLPVLSPGVPALVLSLAVLGAASATLDVAMNAQAAAIEARYGRTLMSSFHALFSAGGVAGAALAGSAMALGTTPGAHVVVTALAASAAVLAAWPALLPSPPASHPRAPVFARPTGALANLGLLAFAALLAEGAMADWSAVYLRSTLRTTPAVAATGFAAFSLAMAAGRFGGDGLVRRIGPRRLLRASGALASSGLGAALLVGHPVAGIAGFALVGLGLANLVPILFGAAARTPGVAPAPALAAVATSGYAGFLAGPPLIGVVAEAAGLPLALGLVVACCALVAARPGGISPPGRREASRPSSRGAPSDW